MIFLHILILFKSNNDNEIIFKIVKSFFPLYMHILTSQDMLPDVDSGIFLDNDMLVLQECNI